MGQQDINGGRAPMDKGQKKEKKAQEKLKDFLASKSYEVLEEVGKGGSGIVCKAIKKEPPVAIKCIPLEQADKQRLATERRVLEKFGGKNSIIECKDSFKNGNTYCFVLRYIKHDKPEVLKEEIRIDQLRWYGYFMFQALAALHKGGVIHGDVKPRHFLFSRERNKGYLIDFNHARFLDKNHIHGSPMPSKQPMANDAAGPWVGTEGFRAPEVLFSSPHQGAKLDIWSAGVSLLYLIIGKTPFTGDPEQDIKDIAEMRGREELWEVVTLHKRESSLPEELFKELRLKPLQLRDWCKKRMKPEKEKLVKDACKSLLLDLLDKCLTGNPRLRIGAEEALKHEFFAPCRGDHEQCPPEHPKAKEQPKK